MRNEISQKGLPGYSKYVSDTVSILQIVKRLAQCRLDVDVDLFKCICFEVISLHFKQSKVSLLKFSLKYLH